MTDAIWNEVIGRITPNAPENLDGALPELSPNPAKAGAVTFPAHAAGNVLPVSFEEETTVCFGARVTEKTLNKTALAMSLAMMAAEKGAFPVILSHVPDCGLERFGFRVERIGGKTDEEIAANEAQVCAFWNIVMVI